MLSRRIKFRTGYLYHVYNRGNRKKKIYYRERDYECFYNLIFKYGCKFDVIVCGYCFLPNHFHLMLYIPGDGSVPRFMQGVGISYTLYVNKRYQLVGHVFQGRYQAKEVSSKEGIDRLVSYLEDNPVKEGLVTKPEYYRWLEIRSNALSGAKRMYDIAKKRANI